MSHPLVTQLHFARAEFVRCLQGITEDDACHRIQPMNCISWIIGHLANQEHFYWVLWAQGEVIAPGLDDLVGYGRPASTPSLEEMWKVWRTVNAAADIYLSTLTPNRLQSRFEYNGKADSETIGTRLYRNIYHYWFHIGEAHAIRQQLGHASLPDFVGDMSEAGYQPE